MTDHVLTPGGEVIEGLVLCRVGGDRLAVCASEVAAFEAATSSAFYAGTRFTPDARAPEEARLLRHELVALVVDSVEVHAERYPLLAVPPALSSSCGGALTGFVEAGGLLWPVVSLARFAADDAKAGQGEGAAPGGEP